MRSEKKVFERLCGLVDEWIEIYGEELHERLVIASMKVSESLNSYCVKVLKDEFGL